MSFKEKLLMVYDVLFVLVLCFAVLLTAMRLTAGGEGIVTGYTVNPVPLAGVLISCGAYLAYMLTKSLKGLRELTENMPEGDETKEGK